MTSESLFHWLAWGVAGLAAALGAWALVGDRSRGRRRCPRCWYSMDGASGLKCPECGREAGSERRLFKSRRRWRWAGVALLILLGAPVLGVWPRAAQEGWRAALPTRVVVELLPIGGEKGGMGVELTARMGLGPRRSGRWKSELTDEDRVVILRRCIEGSLLARPIDQRWRDSYGAFLKKGAYRLYDSFSEDVKRGLRGEPVTDELTGLVMKQAELPVVLSVRTRPVWPEGTPVSIDAEVKDWWPPFMFKEVDGTWSANGGAAKGRYAGIGEIEVNVGLGGAVTVDLDLDILQNESLTPGRPRRKVQHETARVAYTTAPTIDEVLPPVSGPTIDGLVARGLYLSWGATAGFDADARNLGGAGFDDVAFGVVAEVMHGEELVASQRVRWMGAGHLAGASGTVMEGPRPDMKAMQRVSDAKDQPGWSIRLRSDPQWALYVLDAKRYWKGEVVIPMEWGDDSRVVPPQRPLRPAKP